MSDSPKPYVIRQGDTLLRLALTFGVEPTDIQKLPQNSALASDLKSSLLPVGEKLFIPPRKPPTLTVTPGTTNSFQAAVPMHDVVIVFENADGPLANEAYEITGLGGDPVQGALDGAGTLDIAVPATVERIVVTFPKRFVAHTVWVGHLAPARQPQGLEARLVHLAYAAPGAESTLSGADGQRRVLESFQSAQGLPASGSPDAATLDRLGKQHLC